MLADFLRTIPRDNYVIERNGDKINLKFLSFEYILSSDIRAKIMQLSPIVSYIGEEQNGSDIVDLRLVENINEFTLIINQDKLKEKYISETKITEINLIIELSDEPFYKYNNLEYLKCNKINIVINPLWDKNINNDYIYFLNTDQIPIGNNVATLLSKIENIRKNTNLLYDDYYIPDIFICNKQLLHNSFKTEFIKSFISSISSLSIKNQNKYILEIKGYKQMSFQIEDDELKNVLEKGNINSIIELYMWLNEDIKIYETKLYIIRNLITMACNGFNDILIMISGSDFIKSCKNHYNLIIQGSIKQHFENIDKANTRVQDYIAKIDDQLNKSTGSINAIALGILGFLITTSTRIIEVNSKIMLIFLILLLSYILIIKYIVLVNIKAIKDQLFSSINQFKDDIVNKLKIISDETANNVIEEPIRKNSERFERTYDRYIQIIDVILIVIIIYVIFSIFKI